MLLIRRLALYLLPFTAVEPAEGRGKSLNPAFGGGEAQQKFEELLQALPDETLHTALHSHLEPKYQDGVYQDDRTAVSRVHDENPSLASRLIAAARLEFVKRQADNTTTTPATTTTTTDEPDSTTPPASTTQTPTSTPTTPTTSPTDGGGGASTPPSSTQTGGGAATTSATSQDGGDSGSTQTTAQGGAGSSSGSGSSGGTTAAGGGNGGSGSASSSSPAPVVVPVQVTSTNAQGETVVSSTSAVAASPSVSAVVPTTVTGADGSTTVSSATVAGAVVDTTNAAGETVQTTVPVSSYQPRRSSTSSGSRGINTVVTNSDGLPITLTGVTSGQVIRTTDAQGHTFVTTFTPGGGEISQIVFRTSTNARGQPVTLTSFVAAPSAIESDGPEDAPSNTGTPTLQSGLAAQPGIGRELLAVVGAGMLGAAALA